MEGCCPSDALTTFASCAEPVNLMVTKTSPEDPAAAEGPETISGQRLCLKGKPPPPKSAEPAGALWKLPGGVVVTGGRSQRTGGGHWHSSSS